MTSAQDYRYGAPAINQLFRQPGSPWRSPSKPVDVARINPLRQRSMAHGCLKGRVVKHHRRAPPAVWMLAIILMTLSPVGLYLLGNLD